MQVRRSIVAGPYSSMLALACSAVALAAGAPAALAQEGATADDGDIVVTATRRATSVQDIPYNVSAVGSEQIESLGITDVGELARVVPGLAVVDVGPRNNGSTIIRGLSVDPLRTPDTGDNGTVAVYVNETPILLQPKIFDIARVEVLRGPQGTLYGSGSLGGAIRYIVNNPDLDEVGGRVRARGYQIAEADELSGEIEAVLNLPLVQDVLGLRIAGLYLNDSGYTDYPLIRTGPQEDVDTEERITGRVALTAVFTPWLDATLSYYHDQQDVGGRTGITPSYTGAVGPNPNFTQPGFALALRFEEPSSTRDSITALETNVDLGWANLVSSTSYVQQQFTGQRDQTDLLIGFGYGYELFPDFNAFTREESEFTAFVQELRLVSDHEGPIEWIVGAYYTDEANVSSSREFTPGFPQFIGVLRPDNLEYFETDDNDDSERAVFGEVTWNITDAFQVTGGLRSFQLKQDTLGCLAFPLLDDPNTTDVTFHCSSGSSDIEDTIFKFNTSYDLSEDAMVYFTFSQGFRRGGANSVPVGGQVNILPDELSFDPDTVDNFEAGLRSTWLDGRLVLNAAAFFIDWQDIQVAARTATGSIPITANAGGAESKGLELETSLLINDNWSISAAGAYVDAQLTEDFQSSGDTYLAGTRLPGSPEYQFSVAVDYTRPIGAQGTLVLHADANYTSSITTYAGLTHPDYLELDGYALANVSASYEHANGWSGRVFVNNIENNTPFIGQRGPQAYGDQGRFFVTPRPRVVGLEIAKEF